MVDFTPKIADPNHPAIEFNGSLLALNPRTPNGRPELKMLPSNPVSSTQMKHTRQVGAKAIEVLCQRIFHSSWDIQYVLGSALLEIT